MNNTSTCRGCGAPIIWLETTKGKKMCVEDNETARAYAADGALYETDNEGLVPHWIACPKRDEFRRDR